MKKIFLFLVFAFTFSNAQYLVEDNDISENSKELGKQSISYDLNNPLEFYRLKCENVVYAQFPGGENAFKQKLFLNMKSLLDTGLYSVNGTFELVITLDKSGKTQSFQLNPEVPNSNLLKRDLETALRKMNPKFTPASCNGTPIDSKLRQKINFRTENFDL
jgi:hypothetical protein